MEYFDLLIENYFENFEMINELYVGETDFIKKFIKVIHDARQPYVGKPMKAIKGDKNLIKIGDMIADEFGFYSVSFMVPFNTALNAFTFPVTMSLDTSVKNMKPKFNMKSGMKHNTVNRLSTIIAVTAGVWFNEEFSDREVAAAILHEVGHSFVIQSDRLIEIIEAYKILIIFDMAYKLFMNIINSVPDERRRGYNTKQIQQMITNLIYNTNIGKQIINSVEREISENPLFYTLSNMSESLSAIYMQFIKEVSAVTQVNKLLNIPIAVLKWFTGILTKPFVDSKRSQEYLSDSFATMYGLGPEISSFLVKIEYSPSSQGSIIEKVINQTPILGALSESLNIPTLLIMNSVADHPSTLARIKKIKDELNSELNNSDLSPSTKKAIKQNLLEMEKVEKSILDTSKGCKHDSAMVKQLWFNFLNDKGNFANFEEKYLTDIKYRNKKLKLESTSILDDIELI